MKYYALSFINIILLSLILLLPACTVNKLPPLPVVSEVNINKFMGDWYVIAVIPTSIEKKAYNALESYNLNQEGEIETTFRFRQGSFDAPLKEYKPKGFVVPGTGNAIWRMQFFWPFKTDYRISYLTKDYSLTIIAREARDYVWLMARQPVIAENTYDEMIRIISSLGYDTEKIRKVPQDGRKP